MNIFTSAGRYTARVPLPSFPPVLLSSAETKHTFMVLGGHQDVTLSLFLYQTHRAPPSESSPSRRGSTSVPHREPRSFDSSSYHDPVQNASFASHGT